MADPTFSRRYRAAATHDGRFDGLFVTAWPMSETFCRPGCSSRTPRPSRVTFYRTSAAALAARMRPCPRCRPDMTPPAAELFSGDDLGQRAVRMITDGAIDRLGVSGVAKQLRITPRHLLRAVQTIADCGPLDYARAVRVRAARILLGATMLPIREVAAASGFATVRQFNATILELSGATPSAVRYGPRSNTHRSNTRREAQPGLLVARFVLPGGPTLPIEVFEGLADQAVPEVEAGGDHWFARTVRLPHAPGHMRLDRDSTGKILARLAVADVRDFIPLLARTEAFIAAAGQIDAFDGVTGDGHTGGGPVSILGAIDSAEFLFRRAVAQELPEANTRTVLGGLAAALGEASAWGTVFPSMTAIAAQGAEVLRGPKSGIDAVLRVATAIAKGDIDIPGGWTAAELIRRHASLL